MTNNLLLDEIYNDLLVAVVRDEINVFLCGKKTSDADSIRNIIHKDLQNFPRINIFFPEWLFPNLLEQTDEDLITLESALANDVDKIILPLEGFGAICELGAFSIKQEIRDKLIVLNDKEHSIRKSFINLGPIKLIRNRSKGSVVVYESILSIDNITDIRNRILYGRYRKASIKVSNMFTLLYLIGLIIAIYQPIEKEDIATMLINWKPEINKKHIDPVLESLIEFERIQVYKKTPKKEYFSLTKKGFEYYHTSIQYSRKLRQYYKLRALAIWTNRRNRSNFNYIREKAKLLENS